MSSCCLCPSDVENGTSLYAYTLVVTTYSVSRKQMGWTICTLREKIKVSRLSAVLYLTACICEANGTLRHVLCSVMLKPFAQLLSTWLDSAEGLSALTGMTV